MLEPLGGISDTLWDVATIRIRSIEDPLIDAGVARRAFEALILSESMGLLPPGESIERLDLAVLRATIGRAAEVGVSRLPAGVLAGRPSSAEIKDAVASLIDALEGSPTPATEWPALSAVFGVDRLAGLVGVSEPSARRYSAGTRATPLPVAVRLHFLARIVAYLRGSYNDMGVRHWFERVRTQLDDRSPTSALGGGWDPDAPEAQAVLGLARSLVGSPAT